MDCHAFSGQAGVHALEIVYNASADSPAIGKIFLADGYAYETRSIEYITYVYCGGMVQYSLLNGMNSTAYDVSVSTPHWSIGTYQMDFSLVDKFFAAL